MAPKRVISAGVVGGSSGFISWFTFKLIADGFHLVPDKIPLPPNE